MRLGDIFSDGLVLQANKPVRVFGEGNGTVSVTLDGICAESVSDNGKWVVELPSFTYGGPYTMTVIMNGEKQELSDIMVGETVLVSGQSNSRLALRDTDTPPSEYEDDDLLRMYSAGYMSETGEVISEGGLYYCKKDTLLTHSALGYLIGRKIRKKLGVAVGVTVCGQDASVIESWMSEETASRKEFYIPVGEKMYDHFIPQFTAWNRDGVLYHALFERITPFSFGRAVWYQGESDTAIAEGRIYADMLAAMISDWRNALHDKALPFYIVGIADYDDRPDEGWRAIQKAQEDVQDKAENVKTVSAAAVSRSVTIHPIEKAALAASIFESIISTEGI